MKRLIAIVLLLTVCGGCAMLKRAALAYAGQPIQDKTKVPQYPIPTRTVR